MVHLLAYLTLMERSMNNTCKSLLGSVLAGTIGLTTYAAFAAQSASNLVAHRAYYEMSMGDKLQNSHIVNISGRSAFALEHDCSGWRSIEDYIIQFVADTGGQDRVMSHFESWEADSGDKYSFDIMEQSSFDGRKQFGGFAQLDDDRSGNAFYTQDPQPSVELPSNTVFPMQHVRNILEQAENGEKLIAATLFTGAEPENALMRTSTVVGGWRDEAAQDLGELAEDGYWQINVAYFNPEATTAEPEYEIQFEMQRNGLVRNYVIDYGDFSINARLTEAEEVEAKTCS